MTPRLVLVVASLVVLETSAFADKQLGLPELKELVAKAAFEEAYQHLGDIAPTARTAGWLDVAADTAAGLIVRFEDEKGRIGLIDQIDRDYPQLVKHPRYAKVRAEHGPIAIEACFAHRAAATCTPFAARFLKHAADKALTLRVAKIVRRELGVGSLPMFATAITLDVGTCKDPDAKLAIVAGVGLPADHELTKSAVRLVETCFDAIKEDVQKAFEADASGGNTQRNTCDLLARRKLLSPLQLKVCKKK